MPRVVILGGGFAGFSVARILARQAFDVVLVDRSSYHLYTPLLYEVATGFLASDERQRKVALREGVGIPLTAPGLTILQDEVVGMDPTAHRVFLKEQGETSYDFAVVALGSEPDFFGIPGAAARAIPLKFLEHAFHIRDRLHDLIEMCRQGKQERFRVIVVGGGPNGVETAAELARFAQVHRCNSAMLANHIEISLVEAGPCILHACSAAVRNVAGKRLTRLGVRILSSAPVASVQQDRIQIKTPEGERHLPYDLLIWAGGVKPVSVVSSLGLPVSLHGFLCVGETLQVEGCKNVFALGDSACVLDETTGSSVPGLAQVALEEAEVVSENIKRVSEDRTPLRAARFSWQTIIPLGGRYAVAEIGGVTVKGIAAYALRKAADLRYFLRVLPPLSACRIWFRGAKTFMHNEERGVLY
ncbi:NAD(P)/FAD-dependent oxidoreductase [Candidatus Uhrbacteria bacterium]|nr:NAD(P)/FAD-dependent oxidoreductase [Candidatus Uhrbacteria bacterium]